MRSLKGTLFRGVILGSVLVLMAAGSVLYFSVSAQLVRQMDASLGDKARMLSLSVEEKQYGLEVDLEEIRTEDMEEVESPEFLYIGSLDGRIIYRSSFLDGVPIPSFMTPVQDQNHDWYELPDGRRLRSVLFTFIPEVDDEEEDLESIAQDPRIVVDELAGPGDHVVIQLFKDASGHERFLDLFMFMLLATGFGSIGVLSLTVWWTIKKGADPVNELASRIEEINDDDLSVRLDEGMVFTELAPIVHKLNLLLDRLNESFTREKGFTSDAAHELRTPLAGLKSTIEVALARKREVGEYQETLGRALEIVSQLESLVKSLLALARLESGQDTADNGSEIVLDSCIMNAWGSYSEAAGEKHVETFFDFNNGNMTTIDNDLFAQVLEELFRNAVYYVDHGGSISMNLLHQDDGPLRFRISNSGSMVSSQESARVFDRFWRGTHSRDDTGVRFGLGHPIVRKIVENMGIEMEVMSEMGGEFVVTLIMPA